MHFFSYGFLPWQILQGLWKVQIVTACIIINRKCISTTKGGGKIFFKLIIFLNWDNIFQKHKNVHKTTTSKLCFNLELHQDQTLKRVKRGRESETGFPPIPAFEADLNLFWIQKSVSSLSHPEPLGAQACVSSSVWRQPGENILPDLHI